MDTSSGQGPGRLRLRTPWPYRVMNIVFALLFFGVVLLAVFANQNTAAGFTWYWLLAAAAGGVGVAFLLSRLFAIMPPPSKRVEILVVVLLFAAYATVQALAGWSLRVQPDSGWDFGLVHQYAAAYAQNGTLPDEYFLLFPNNAGIYFLLANYYAILTLFGVTNLEIAAFVLNIVAIDGALVLLYFCGRRLFGARQALFLLVCAFLTLPFLMYTPIWYTDTLTLVFPIATALLWLQTRTLWRDGKTGRAIGRFCVLSLVAGAGSILKITVAILWVAAVIDLLVLLRGKGRWKVLLAGLAVMLVVAVGGTFAVRYSSLLPRYDYQKEGIPFTHWIMMGLSGNGDYNDDDYQAVLAVDGENRAAYISNEIGERLQDMGFFGTLEHLGRKAAYTFGDGTYTAAEKLDRSAAQIGPLHAWFVKGGQYNTLLHYLAFAVEMAMLVWMAVAAIKALIRGNNALTFLRIALFGLVLFLMLWETRARYLVNYLPIFLLCAVEAAPPPGRGKAARRQARLAHIKAMQRPQAAAVPPRPEDDLDALPLDAGMTGTQRFRLQRQAPPQALFGEEPPAADTLLQQTQPIWPQPDEMAEEPPRAGAWPEGAAPEDALPETPAADTRPKAELTPESEAPQVADAMPDADDTALEVAQEVLQAAPANLEQDGYLPPRLNESDTVDNPLAERE
ncbi:MAG: hypothetical protein GXY32_06645 [Ruminococcaceae bacterium]|nr:hypothetical protein [Oscillospiraceae bacterium]